MSSLNQEMLWQPQVVAMAALAYHVAGSWWMELSKKNICLATVMARKKQL